MTFEDDSGTRHTAFLNRNLWSEIILSAGAIGSPQLLMLSGIGPAYHLRAHGIPVVLDHPMVGQGMADNPMNLLFVPSPVPVEVSLIQVVGITQFGSFIETASGLTFAYSWAQGFVRDYELSLNKVFTHPPKTLLVFEIGPWRNVGPQTHASLLSNLIAFNVFDNFIKLTNGVIYDIFRQANNPY